MLIKSKTTIAIPPGATLIFEKKGDEIQIASIKEIVDYH